MLDGSVPVKYGLRLNSEMKYWDLKKQLSDLCALDPELMLICELSNSQIRCILVNEKKIEPSTACELYVYELPKFDNMLVRSRAGSELAINIEKGLKDIQRTPGRGRQCTFDSLEHYFELFDYNFYYHFLTLPSCVALFSFRGYVVWHNRRYTGLEFWQTR